MSHFWVIRVTAKPQVPPGFGPAGWKALPLVRWETWASQSMWQEKPARSQSPHSQACRHTSVSLRWSSSNSLPSELANQGMNLIFKRKRQKSWMATVRDGFQRLAPGRTLVQYGGNDLEVAKELCNYPTMHPVHRHPLPTALPCQVQEPVQTRTKSTI